MAEGRDGVVINSERNVFDVEECECYCGLPAKICTSRTSKNPSRKFWGCLQHVTGCGFFKWYDEWMNEIMLQQIRQLKNNLERFEAETDGRLTRMNSTLISTSRELAVVRRSRDLYKIGIELKNNLERFEAETDGRLTRMNSTLITTSKELAVVGRSRDLYNIGLELKNNLERFEAETDGRLTRMNSTLIATSRELDVVRGSRDLYKIGLELKNILERFEDETDGCFTRMSSTLITATRELAMAVKSRDLYKIGFYALLGILFCRIFSSFIVNSGYDDIVCAT
ncbi:hypothetical protein DITRI_Ditri16bG0021500 [Diplodiscus trichospermus]